MKHTLILTSALALSALAAAPTTAPNKPAATAATTSPDELHVPLKLTGGHDTDPRDHGRPVALIAAALKVPDDVFRETFTHVRPAGPGRNGPTEAEARDNKKALMDGLSKYGVTNDRLNEVSNYYRYASWKGETWKQSAASGYATVRDGVVTGITVTDAGAGYTSAPTVTLPGYDGVKLKPTLAYGTDFAKNGSIEKVAIEK